MDWNLFWDIISKVSSVLGIIAFFISIGTLWITGGIRKSLLAHVESSDYRKDIDQQIMDLEASRKLLIEGNIDRNEFYSKLLAKLDDIKMAYETILPHKVIKAIDNLRKNIQSKHYLNPSKHSQTDNEKYASQLAFIIAELKKEKKIL